MFLIAGVSIRSEAAIGGRAGVTDRADDGVRMFTFVFYHGAQIGILERRLQCIEFAQVVSTLDDGVRCEI